MNCVICDKPLTGGTDTFGNVGAEMCMTDWFEMIAEWNTFVDTQNFISVEERREAMQKQFEANREFAAL